MTLLKRVLQPFLLPAFPSSALLFLRLIVGLAFIFHGWGKIQSPFAWMPPDSPVPGILQFLAAFSEFGGGIALILGLLTPVAMLGLGFTMAVATCMHALVLKDPFVNPKGGGSYELALVYLAIAILFIALGPGKFSLDAMLFGNRQPKEPAQ
ncbi:MAG: DoxX family protein [Candidatus Hydrogenedentes bacterium]|nr:DoxX family protein [Candidatus Hydrogenedentota bacterium]